jgi:monoterpene epsilon-lactone hydrolase
MGPPVSSSPKRQEDGVVSREMLLAHNIWREFAASTAELALGETRRALDQLMLSFGAPRDVLAVSSELGGLPVVDLVAVRKNPRCVILWLHGGAYCMGSTAGYRHFGAHLAQVANARVILPEYRLAPEHHYPDPVDDACAAYLALRARADGCETVILAGDSAGGGLAMATLLRLREQGHVLPAGCVLVSPWLDLTLSGSTLVSHADLDPLLSRAMLAGACRAYLNGADRSSALLSPLDSDLSGLPPMLIQVGEREVLLDDSRRLAERGAAHGVQVTLQVEPAAPHVFQLFASFLPEAHSALRRIGGFIGAATVRPT